jgi:hypothetical protein
MNITNPMLFKMVRDNYYQCILNNEVTDCFIVGDINRFNTYDPVGVSLAVTGARLFGSHEITVDEVINLLKGLRICDLSMMTTGSQLLLKDALR